MNYLEISHSYDFKTFSERIFFRFLEIFPGFLSLLTIFLATIFSFILPHFIAIFIILFDLYWFFKVLYLTFHQIICYRKLKENLRINWLEKLKEIEDWEKIYHLVLLAVYQEPKKTIEKTLNSILNSNYPKEKIIVVLSFEERGGEKMKKIAKDIEKNFSQLFTHFILTFHPLNLPDEIPGRGSNMNWAFLEAKRKIVDPLNIPPENIICSIFDVDTRIFPEYFSILSFKFLKEKNYRVAFQPIPLYMNNFSKTTFFSRVSAFCSTFWQMMQQERPEQLVTFSSHAIPFKVLEEVNYPKNVISDDSRIFWKSLLFYNGNFNVIPLFYPVSMDAVSSPSLLKTIKNLYLQQRRWAWGVTEIPYLIFNFLKNKTIPKKKKIFHSLILIEGFWSWAVAPLLIFFLGWLPLVLGGERFSQNILAFNLPRLTSNLMTFAMVGIFVSVWINFSLFSQGKRKNFFQRFKIFFQWLALPIVLIFFGSFPALDAQIRLLLGKYLDFWPTEKYD